ncbi:hypothetical protein [Pyxidicoccus xibeiensis]|uniref:hypothetical protein n=1 Tax=Pyxidicoccus xibeiensis TaxID=2906759 RepID=UPI0020A73EA1|nr:hypothetical protein [Pyxidicoccus xibeiensis]MCP3135746.1 hypothetical protein [Pyxidicoccus xibeiensis]
MLRIWLCLCLLLFAPSVGGLLATVSGMAAEVCSQRCPDDDAQGQCAPDCTDCTCCGHVRSVAAPVPMPSLTPRADRPPLFAHEEKEPPSAHVGDILHVPIAVLA